MNQAQFIKAMTELCNRYAQELSVTLRRELIQKLGAYTEKPKAQPKAPRKARRGPRPRALSMQNQIKEKLVLSPWLTAAQLWGTLDSRHFSKKSFGVTLSKLKSEGLLVARGENGGLQYALANGSSPTALP